MMFSGIWMLIRSKHRKSSKAAYNESVLRVVSKGCVGIRRCVGTMCR